MRCAGLRTVSYTHLDVYKRQLVARMAEVTPHAKVAAAGGVNPANAADYARAGAHILVTSAPYFAPPSDIKVVISAR